MGKGKLLMIISANLFAGRETHPSIPEARLNSAENDYLFPTPNDHHIDKAIASWSVSFRCGSSSILASFPLCCGWIVCRDDECVGIPSLSNHFTLGGCQIFQRIRRDRSIYELS